MHGIGACGMPFGGSADAVSAKAEASSLIFTFPSCLSHVFYIYLGCSASYAYWMHCFCVVFVRMWDAFRFLPNFPFRKNVFLLRIDTPWAPLCVCVCKKSRRASNDFNGVLGCTQVLTQRNTIPPHGWFRFVLFCRKCEMAKKTTCHHRCERKCWFTYGTSSICLHLHSFHRMDVLMGCSTYSLFIRIAMGSMTNTNVVWCWSAT